ncbi:hypothetical protein GCM10027612_73100 [Microbispora bryophytorum subsp. camponoti]
MQRDHAHERLTDGGVHHIAPGIGRERSPYVRPIASRQPDDDVRRRGTEGEVVFPQRPTDRRIFPDQEQTPAGGEPNDVHAAR